MKRSTERILTTHTGSLPRPPDLSATLEALAAELERLLHGFEERFGARPPGNAGDTGPNG